MKNFAIVILSLMLAASTLVHVADGRRMKALQTDFQTSIKLLDELSNLHEARVVELRDALLKLKASETKVTELEKKLANRCKPIFWYRLFDKEN